MLGALTSLSLSSGAAVVAVVSALLAFAWVRCRSAAAAWGLGLTAPLGVAFVLYWAPVWVGEGSSEYSSWAPLFIAPWYLAGATASVLVMALVRKKRARPNLSR